MLDTHSFLWWLEGNTRLPVAARNAIADPTNDKLISAASVWEIAIKHNAGKLEEVGRYILDMPAVLVGEGFEELPITVEDGVRAGMLPDYHRDPFDRMLIAQALGRNLMVVSVEALFDRYGVRRLW